MNGSPYKVLVERKLEERDNLLKISILPLWISVHYIVLKIKKLFNMILFSFFSFFSSTKTKEEVHQKKKVRERNPSHFLPLNFLFILSNRKKNIIFCSFYFLLFSFFLFALFIQVKGKPLKYVYELRF